MIDAKAFSVDGGQVDSQPHLNSGLNRFPLVPLPFINRAALIGRYPEVKDSDRRTLLIFGQGPVISVIPERINYWSVNLAQAAAIMEKIDPTIDNFYCLGGKTGTPGSQASEATLIANEMLRLGVPPHLIRLENQSSDTIENIINFLNLDSDNEMIDNPRKISILTAPFHSRRVQILLNLFRVPIGHIFTSTEVIRLAAKIPTGRNRPSDDQSEWDHSLLQATEDMVNLNNPTLYSSKQPREERRDVSDRVEKDDMLTRELLEFPEKWLPYVGKLRGGEQVWSILWQVDKLYPGLLTARYGIEINIHSNEALDRVRRKLSLIPPYQGLPEDIVARWIQQSKLEGWPKDTQSTLNKLIREGA